MNEWLRYRYPVTNNYKSLQNISNFFSDKIPKTFHLTLNVCTFFVSISQKYAEIAKMTPMFSPNVNLTKFLLTLSYAIISHILNNCKNLNYQFNKTVEGNLEHVHTNNIYLIYSFCKELTFSEGISFIVVCWVGQS